MLNTKSACVRVCAYIHTRTAHTCTQAHAYTRRMTDGGGRNNTRHRRKRRLLCL